MIKGLAENKASINQIDRASYGKIPENDF